MLIRLRVKQKEAIVLVKIELMLGKDLSKDADWEYPTEAGALPKRYLVVGVHINGTRTSELTSA
jgi:hypothetical protein